jgi:hypothetical protein
MQDLQTSLRINKQLILALVDSIKSEEYKDSFQLFQEELTKVLE